MGRGGRRWACGMALGVLTVVFPRGGMRGLLGKKSGRLNRATVKYGKEGWLPMNETRIHEDLVLEHQDETQSFPSAAYYAINTSIEPLPTLRDARLDGREWDEARLRDQYLMEKEFKQVLSRSGVIDTEKSILHVSLPETCLERIERETGDLLLREVDRLMEKGEKALSRQDRDHLSIRRKNDINRLSMRHKIHLKSKLPIPPSPSHKEPSKSGILRLRPREGDRAQTPGKRQRASQKRGGASQESASRKVRVRLRPREGKNKVRERSRIGGKSPRKTSATGLGEYVIEGEGEQTSSGSDGLAGVG